MESDVKIPAPYKPHPGLSAQVNANIAESELNGGVWLKDIAVGARLLIATRNTKYILDKVEEDKYLIKGNAKYCPEFVRVNIAGSTWGGSMLKMGFIGRQMHLEMVIKGFDGTITTSTIQEIIEL